MRRGPLLLIFVLIIAGMIFVARRGATRAENGDIAASVGATGGEAGDVDTGSPNQGGEVDQLDTGGPNLYANPADINDDVASGNPQPESDDTDDLIAV